MKFMMMHPVSGRKGEIGFRPYQRVKWVEGR